MNELAEAIEEFKAAFMEEFGKLVTPFLDWLARMLER